MARNTMKNHVFRRMAREVEMFGDMFRGVFVVVFLTSLKFSREPDLLGREIRRLWCPECMSSDLLHKIVNVWDYVAWLLNWLTKMCAELATCKFLRRLRGSDLCSSWSNFYVSLSSSHISGPFVIWIFILHFSGGHRRWAWLQTSAVALDGISIIVSWVGRRRLSEGLRVSDVYVFMPANKYLS